jgi:SAM-dependent methyltransferase
MDYHPNFFSPQESKRADCYKRLDILKENLEFGSILDIGCSGGFYSFGLSNICNTITAIDNQQNLIDDCLRIQNENNTNVNFLCEDLLNFDFFKKWNNVLYLSTHHHVIAEYGLETASKLLNKISKNCNVMFFDMGQKNEQECQMHKWWQLLPFIDPLQWIPWHFKANTDFTRIWNIGSSKIHGIDRFLWKLDKYMFFENEKYIVNKKLYRTKGSIKQRLVEEKDNIESRRTFYIVEKDNILFWVKEYTDPSLGFSIQYEYDESNKFVDLIIFEGHNISSVRPLALEGNKILFEYCDKYKTLPNTTLNEEEKNIVKKLLCLWIDQQDVHDYDLVPNNIMIKKADKISIKLIDFEYSEGENKEKWNKTISQI